MPMINTPGMMKATVTATIRSDMVLPPRKENNFIYPWTYNKTEPLINKDGESHSDGRRERALLASGLTGLRGPS